MAQSLLYHKQSSLSAAINVAAGLSSVAGFTIPNAGSGYAVGDLLTVSGGTAAVAATLYVLRVSSSGAILSLAVANVGVYTTKPTNPASTTSTGRGTGATLALTWSDNVPPPGTKYVIAIPETQNVRWRVDAAPTTTDGMILSPGSALVYDGADFASLQFIEITASATLRVTFYG